MHSALKWLLERGHDVVYQTRQNGVRGHFLLLAYLRTPHMSFHEYHQIEGADFNDCIVAARAWVKALTPKVPNPNKNPRKVAGGAIGGRARAAKLTAERRTEIAKKAANARWGRV